MLSVSELLSVSSSSERPSASSPSCSSFSRPKNTEEREGEGERGKWSGEERNRVQWRWVQSAVEVGTETECSGSMYIYTCVFHKLGLGYFYPHSNSPTYPPLSGCGYNLIMARGDNDIHDRLQRPQ